MTLTPTLSHGERGRALLKSSGTRYEGTNDMKKTLGIGIGLLIAVAATAQTGGWFVQDFEGAEVGKYTELSYSTPGVEVTLTAAAGSFRIVDNGLGGLLGGHSLVTSKSKRPTVIIDFSTTIHGINLDMLSECGFEDRIPTLKCFDAAGGLLFTLSGNVARPCNQFARFGASILGASIIASCEAANGMFDNLVVEP